MVAFAVAAEARLLCVIDSVRLRSVQPRNGQSIGPAADPDRVLQRNGHLLRRASSFSH